MTLQPVGVGVGEECRWRGVDIPGAGASAASTAGAIAGATAGARGRLGVMVGLGVAAGVATGVTAGVGTTLLGFSETGFTAATWDLQLAMDG